MTVSIETLRAKIPDLLPPNTRAVAALPQILTGVYKHSLYSSLNFLVEVPPKVTRVNFGSSGFRSWGGKATPPATGLVAMPWQYFIFVNAFTSYSGRLSETSTLNLHVLWSKAQIKSLDEELLFGRIPDIEERYDGLVCLGHIAPASSYYVSKINKTVKEIMSMFYTFSQGTDMHSGGVNLPLKYNSLGEWEKDTEDDAYCYLNWQDWESKSLKRVSLRTFFPKEIEVGADK